MEYVPIENISINNECTCNISKRNIHQIITGEDESFILSNKRSCIIEEMKLYRKDSLRSLKVHTDTDFEHAISTESRKHIRTHRIKPIPIIFHFASEEIMDIEKYGSDNKLPELNPTYSSTRFSMHNSDPKSMKKSSQLDINRDNTSFQTEAIPSYLIDAKVSNSSLLSISDSSSYRSLDRLQASYCEYLTSRKEERKSSIYEQQNTNTDTQAYIKCRNYHQPIPVQVIASDSEEKLYQFIKSNALSETY